MSHDPYLRFSPRALLRCTTTGDTDKSGTLSRDEFAEAVLSLGLRHVSVADLQAAFDDLDGDGNGTIDYNELDRKLLSLPRERPEVRPPPPPPPEEPPPPPPMPWEVALPPVAHNWGSGVPFGVPWHRPAVQDALGAWWAHTQPVQLPAAAKPFYDVQNNRWATAIPPPPAHHPSAWPAPSLSPPPHLAGHYYHPALNPGVRHLGLHAAGHNAGTAAVQPFGRARPGAGVGGGGGGGGFAVSRKDVVVPLASSMSTGLLLERGGRPAHVEEAVGRARVVEFGRASNLATARHVSSSAAIMANVASAREERLREKRAARMQGAL